MTGWIERQRHFIDFTLASLLRRKWKNITLIIVYTIIVFLIASVIFLTEAIRFEAESVLQDAPQMILQKIVAGRHDLIPLAYIPIIKNIRGILSIKARYWGYYFDPVTNANYTLMASQEHNLADDEIIIGQGIARSWGLEPGTRIALKANDGVSVSFKVKEIIHEASELVAADLVIMTESAFRKISGIPDGFATDLGIEIRRKEELITIAKKIVELLPQTRPILKDEILRTYNSLFNWRSGIVLVLLIGNILAFFIFAWDKATGLSAEERTEIGILKALGWDTSDILIMKFWEATIISLTSYITGVIMAYIHVFFTDSFLFEHALKGWSVLYPKFHLTPTVNDYQLILLFFLTVMPYTLSTIIPAWRVSITDPDIVMRN